MPIVSVTAVVDPVGVPDTVRPIRIEMDDGVEWFTDANLPPDTWLREELRVWIAAGGTIEPPRPG
jgi:hypothetical protein